MNLKDELKKAQVESHEKWFERWYEKQNFECTFLNSAREGFSGYEIKLEDYVSLTEETAYLNSRLRDERTVKLLREKLPDIEIKFMKTSWSNFLGIKRDTEKIVFRWE